MRVIAAILNTDVAAKNLKSDGEPEGRRDAQETSHRSL
jgi:hypothetical protein